MEVDGKLSMGMPPPVPTVHCYICYPGSGDYPERGFCCGTAGVCVAAGIGMKRKFLETSYPKVRGGGYSDPFWRYKREI